MRPAGSVSLNPTGGEFLTVSRAKQFLSVIVAKKVVRLGPPNIACTTLTKFNQKCYNSTVFQALCSGTYEVAFSKTWTPTKNVFESLYANMPLMHMPPSGSQTWLSTI